MEDSSTEECLQGGLPPGRYFSMEDFLHGGVLRGGNPPGGPKVARNAPEAPYLFWDHVGISLGPCWDHFGIALGIRKPPNNSII